MTRKLTHNYSLSAGAARGAATMVSHGEWIMKSARIGASLGGVAGFFYGAYIMAANPTLSWTDVLDTLESIVVHCCPNSRANCWPKRKVSPSVRG